MGNTAAKPQSRRDPARGFWIGQKLRAGGGHPLFLAPSWGLYAVCMLLPDPCHGHQYAGPEYQPVYSSCPVAFSLPHWATSLQTIRSPVSPLSLGLSLNPFVQTLSQGYMSSSHSAAPFPQDSFLEDHPPPKTMSSPNRLNQLPYKPPSLWDRELGSSFSSLC